MEKTLQALIADWRSSMNEANNDFLAVLRTDAPRLTNALKRLENVTPPEELMNCLQAASGLISSLGLLGEGTHRNIAVTSYRVTKQLLRNLLALELQRVALMEENARLKQALSERELSQCPQK